MRVSRKKTWCLSTLFSALLLIAPNKRAEPADQIPRVRFATFNASLNRRSAGELIRDLKTRDNQQARRIAEIIQRIRPHVILINEFDYDPMGLAARLFDENYLSVSQHGQAPVKYRYRYTGPMNTGVPSGLDLNRDGKTDGPADAYGFGWFPGQYGMVVYSMYPIKIKRIRTFQRFLWKDMPDAMLPVDPKSGRSYYKPNELKAFRLSSKSHWDLPIVVGQTTIHFLVAHPTPPVFDGAEDRNGRRNYDEIRLLADYVDPKRSGYIYDDRGVRGGLPAGANFVIAGDMNSDPFDGDSTCGAINQLLKHALANSDVIPSSQGGPQQSRLQGGINRRHKGNPAHDTSDFSDDRVGNLRLDYVIPSQTLTAVDSGVFWPRVAAVGAKLVEASDHRLVWIDVRY